MKGFMAVFRKEVYTFLASPIFYVCAFVFLGLSGYFFYSSVAYFSLLSLQAGQNPYMAEQLNITDIVVTPLFGNMTIIMLILLPLMTMRLFSEEKKEGTAELLFTFPLTDGAILLGKYFSALLMFIIMLAATFPFMVLLDHLSSPDWGTIISAYLGVIFLSGAFISLGLFTSALTENQIVSAVVTFGGLLMLWLIKWIASLTAGWTGKVVDYLAIMDHFENMSVGLIDSRDVVYFLVFIIFFLFCTLRYMDSKRWRA